MRGEKEIKERIEDIERVLDVEWDGKPDAHYSHLIGELRGLKWVLAKVNRGEVQAVGFLEVSSNE